MAVPGVKRICANVLRTVQEPTAAGQIRRQVLFHAPIPFVLFGLLALILRGEWSAPGWTILLAGSVTVGSLLLAFLAQPTPLPEGLSPEVSVRRSLHRFRQITGLRIGLSMTSVTIGAAAAITGGGLFPYVAALMLYWPHLLLALPGYYTVSRARRAMEAWGTKAYLWAGLAQPARVEWPLFTRYFDYRRRVEAAARPGNRAGTEPKATVDSEAKAGSDATGEVGEKHLGVPERLVPTKKPLVRVETLIPGFGAASASPPSLHVQRMRANTRPKKRGSRTEVRRKTKNT